MLLDHCLSVCPLSVTLTYCGQMVKWIKMKLGTEVGLGPGHIVLDGDPAPPKRAQAPFFGPCLLWPNSCMDQDTTGHGGRPWHSRRVRWGPCPPERGHSSPHFSANVKQMPNNWMDQDATWYEGRPRPKPHCITWGPRSPPKKGHSSPPPIFGA